MPGREFEGEQFSEGTRLDQELGPESGAGFRYWPESQNQQRPKFWHWALPAVPEVHVEPMSCKKLIAETVQIHSHDVLLFPLGEARVH